MGRVSNTMLIIVSRHLLQGTNRWEECQTQCSSLYQDIYYKEQIDGKSVKHNGHHCVKTFITRNK